MRAPLQKGHIPAAQNTCHFTMPNIGWIHSLLAWPLYTFKYMQVKANTTAIKEIQWKLIVIQVKEKQVVKILIYSLSPLAMR